MSVAFLRKGKGDNEIKMDPTDVDNDILTPLIETPGSSKKKTIQLSTEPEPITSAPRDVSKLGLFTFTGMAIVLFQVKPILDYVQCFVVKYNNIYQILKTQR